MCVLKGCTLDLIAGRRTRAARWMRRTGLEWLFRLVHEPSHLGLRYFVDGGACWRSSYR